MVDSHHSGRGDDGIGGVKPTDEQGQRRQSGLTMSSRKELEREEETEARGVRKRVNPQECSRYRGVEGTRCRFSCKPELSTGGLGIFWEQEQGFSQELFFVQDVPPPPMAIHAQPKFSTFPLWAVPANPLPSKLYLSEKRSSSIRLRRRQSWRSSSSRAMYEHRCCDSTRRV